MSNKKLIYVHIPKTGGSTLQSILIRQYGKNHFFRINRRNTLADFLEVDKTNINLLVGHFPFDYHKHFNESNNIQYLSLIREPVSRLISNYYHILSRPNNPHHQALTEQTNNIKEFVEQDINKKTENCYVRFFSNNIDTPHNSCTKQMLEKAKKNIEQYFPIVGITEMYDESLIMMKNHYQWEQPYYAKKNKARIKYNIKTDIDEDSINTIKQYNQLDIELYNWVKTRLNQQINNAKFDFEKELVKFRKTNNIIKKIVPIRNKIIGRRN